MASFQNGSDIIDRGKAGDFFEYIAGHEKSSFLCDLGASLSEQLPYYFRDNGAAAIREGLDELAVALTIVCVIGGQNIFSATMGYLAALLTACDGCLNVVAALNDHFPLNAQQQDEFNAFARLAGLEDAFHFDLSNDKNQAAQQKISGVLQQGQGLKNASTFTRILFERSIKNLPL